MSTRVSSKLVIGTYLLGICAAQQTVVMHFHHSPCMPAGWPARLPAYASADCSFCSTAAPASNLMNESTNAYIIRLMHVIMCMKVEHMQGQARGKPMSRHTCSKAMYSSLPSLMKLATALATGPSS